MPERVRSFEEILEPYSYNKRKRITSDVNAARLLESATVDAMDVAKLLGKLENQVRSANAGDWVPLKIAIIRLASSGVHKEELLQLGAFLPHIPVSKSEIDSAA